MLAREQDVPDWRHRGLDRRRRSLGLPAARGERFDVAVATWWETTYALFELRADRYAYFVQSLEDRFYRPDEPERLGAALTHDLPVAFVTEARWIADTLEAMRPDARVPLRAQRDRQGRLLRRRASPSRCATAGRCGSSSRATRRRGSRASATRSPPPRAMPEPRHVTLVAPDGAAPAEPRRRRPGRRAASRTREMAALYAESHVVLKLSRVEGMYGPPLEGFHMGATR